MPPGTKTTEPDAQWPPRSPREALLSTPGGREKYRRMIQQDSPTRRPLSALSYSPKAPIHNSPDLFDNYDAGDGADEDEEEDEDEETLKLKLQAIEAKLKLKRLQSAKAKKVSSAPPIPIEPRVLGGALKSGGMVAMTTARNPPPRPVRQTPLQEIEVPASPAKETRRVNPNTGPGRTAQIPLQEIEVPASPARETRGSNSNPGPGRISPTIRQPLANISRLDSRASSHSAHSTHSRDSTRTYLESRSRDHAAHAPLSGAEALPARPPREEAPKSFAERLASARQDEEEKRDKAARVQASRTTAFSISATEMESYKSTATTIAPSPSDSAPTFTRDEILGKQPPQPSQTATEEGGDGSSGSDSLEPYSSIHLSTRILPHQTLTRTLSSKKILLLKDLLRDVRAPNFDLPDVESDVVVLATIASKSDPKTHKTDPNSSKNHARQQKERGKFMILTLTDLTYELDLFLFDTGFNRFWRLPTGTLVAILNPIIMPPPPGKQDTGRFSLVINSDCDSIIEIGTARDLGHCNAMRKDGQLCSSWVNTRRTHFCEFHVSDAVKKKRTARMEVNSMDGFSQASRRGGRAGGREGKWGGGLNPKLAKMLNSTKGWGPDARDNYKPENRGPKDYDRETHSQFFVARGASAAELIDRGESSFADRKEKEEHLKKRLVREEREREVARKLAEVGRGSGREYMEVGSSRSGTATGSVSGASLASSRRQGGGGEGEDGGQGGQVQQPPPPEKLTAKSLGLIPSKSAGLNLKRKRVIATSTTTTISSSSNPPPSSSPSARKQHPPAGTTRGPDGKTIPLGWGTSLKGKLSRMKEGEALIPADSAVGPARKKTRFLTSGGIKVAGRESDAGGGMANLGDDDSDDELVIVK